MSSSNSYLYNFCLIYKLCSSLVWLSNPKGLMLILLEVLLILLIVMCTASVNTFEIGRPCGTLLGSEIDETPININLIGT
jgi:hypothetical protein